MCGICGLLAPSGRPDPALAERMNAALVHRGPDEGGVDELGRCILAHRRLQVIDLSTGSQPVTNETGDVTAVFNGELYNFHELRRELSGHEVRVTGDTPVIPHLYEEHGVGFVERLGGMFALALWDAPRERLVLARDRVGKKPLLWTRLPDGTIASPRSCGAAAPPKSRASSTRHARRLPRAAARTERGGPPQHRGAPPGAHARRRARRGHRPSRTGGGPRSYQGDWLELVREDSRRRRPQARPPTCRWACPVGRGRLERVVAEMAAAGGAVRTFTVGFGGDRATSACAGGRESGTDRAREIVIEPDVPTSAPLGRASTSRSATGRRCPSLVVSGSRATSPWRSRATATGVRGVDGTRWGSRAGSRCRGGPRGRVCAGPGGGAALARDRAGRLFEVAALPAAARYGRLMEVFPADVRAELWEPSFVREPTPAWELLGQAGEGISGLQRLDVRTYLPGDLLLKADIASMAHSLELRSPLLDHEVLELGVSLRAAEGGGAAGQGRLAPRLRARSRPGVRPREDRLRRPDLALVPGRAARLAADALLDERARARGQLRPAAVQRLLDDHAEGRADHGHRLWCLLMLELWQREHVDAPVPAAVSA
jgi:asparagine synthase (glutamine-hydrolysing)